MTITIQSYLGAMVVLLAIIAVCMVILTIHFLMRGSSKQESNSLDRTDQPYLMSNTDSVADKLSVIKALRDNGTISEEQFQAMKQQILSNQLGRGN